MAYLIPADYVYEPLYVVTALWNPIRFKSRWKHYERFAKYVTDSGGVLVTVEAAHGERHHEMAPGISPIGVPFPSRAPTFAPTFAEARTTNPHQYIRVRTSSEVWIKENLINIGVSRLPPTWKYVAWIDADVMFARPDWVSETIHQLQHYQVVQLFSQAEDVGPRYASIAPAKSAGFGSNWAKGVPLPPLHVSQYYPAPHHPYPYPQHGWHTGYAWAMRREAWDALGGLLDCAIMGAADNHMAHGLIGEADRTLHGKLHPAYKARIREWQFRAERHIRRNVGYVSGLLIHYWHGRKVDRRYRHRWRVLTDNQFNPDRDLKYDWQGLQQLVDRGDARSIRLRDDCMRYFRARNEDSIELDGKPDET